MSQSFLTAETWAWWQFELISAIWNQMSNLNSHFLVKPAPPPINNILSFHFASMFNVPPLPTYASWDLIATVVNNICFSLSFFRVKRFNVCCSAYKLFSMPNITEIRIVSSSCSSKLNYLISWRVTYSFLLWRKAEGLRWLHTEGDLRRTCDLSLARLQKRCYTFKVTEFFVWINIGIHFVFPVVYSLSPQSI